MENKQKILKLGLIVGWIILIILVIVLISLNKPKILKEEKLDFLSTLNDKEEYNFNIQADLSKKYSPLYLCKADTIPSYLDDLAYKIDSNLEKVENPQFLKWKDSQGKDVIVYNIDTTILNLYLDTYATKIPFNTVDRFISNYVDPEIEYFDIEKQEENNTVIYMANRKLGEDELINAGSSDFFYIENGYLINARILLAKIENIKEVVPLISSKTVLEEYINDPVYPRNIVIHSSDIAYSTPQNYENFDSNFKYNECSIKNIDPKLYFTSCNNNYIYYVYEINGVCDVVYNEELYSVPFHGFINAIDPEYVKSLK
jgi:hypothetical protein